MPYCAQTRVPLTRSLSLAPSPARGEGCNGSMFRIESDVLG